jgi:hypothetical protein
MEEKEKVVYMKWQAEVTDLTQKLEEEKAASKKGLKELSESNKRQEETLSGSLLEISKLVDQLARERKKTAHSGGVPPQPPSQGSPQPAPPSEASTTTTPSRVVGSKSSSLQGSPEQRKSASPQKKGEIKKQRPVKK